MNRLLKSISLFFAILVMINAFSLMIIQVEYNLNKDYIAQNLCVNKDKPKMGCHGHCHFTKEIQKATNNDSKSTAPKIRLELDFVSQNALNTTIVKPLIQKIELPSLSDPQLRDYYPSIDKPPC